MDIVKFLLESKASVDARCHRALLFEFLRLSCGSQSSDCDGSGTSTTARVWMTLSASTNLPCRCLPWRYTGNKLISSIGQEDASVIVQALLHVASDIVQALKKICSIFRNCCGNMEPRLTRLHLLSKCATLQPGNLELYVFTSLHSNAMSCSKLN